MSESTGTWTHWRACLQLLPLGPHMALCVYPSVDLKNKVFFFFNQQKWVYPGTAKNYNSGQASYSKTAGKFNKGDKHYYLRKEEEKVRRACCEGKPTGEKRKFREMTVSHRLSGWGSRFLVGDAMYIFSCCGLWLRILSRCLFFLLGLVCNWQFFL